MSEIIVKKLLPKYFNRYIKYANRTNKFTNNSRAVKLLEHAARVKLKIASNKAIIAVNSGTSALHVAALAIDSNNITVQDFTFHSSLQGPLVNAKVVDLHESGNIELSNEDELIVATNCFGHLQDVLFIQDFTKKHNIKVIYDNAATPYSFIQNINSCNFGNASIVSLHHTKPIGFGEGGLLIIDREYEYAARDIINFATNIGIKRGNNYKMSELAAAGILQWWDQFNIDDMSNDLRTTYLNTYSNLSIKADKFPNCADYDNFMPSYLPLLIEDKKVRNSFKGSKYYKPLAGLPNSNKIYKNIICLPITEDINAKNSDSNWLRRLFS